MVVLSASAVPVNDTLCGLPLALSLTCRVAERAPPVVGVKITWIWQFVFGAKLEPHVVVLNEKSPGLAPVIVGVPFRVSVPLPLLARMTVCATLDWP